MNPNPLSKNVRCKLQVYRAADVQRAFFIILFMMIIGEFFSAPAITLADSATLGILKPYFNFVSKVTLDWIAWDLSGHQ